MSNKIENLLNRFAEAAEQPKRQLDAHIAAGKKVIGCYPYYAPEELVHATGMVPMGLWGKPGSPNKAKEYFASFYCSLVQMNLEMALSGELDQLSGVIHSTLCDTLRPGSQNFRIAIEQIPMIFLAHPQNRKPDYGKEYTRVIYTKILNQLEDIAGRKASPEDLAKAIRVFNRSRKARREFVKLAGQHPELVTAVQRSQVLKSTFFMEKSEHTAWLEELNQLLAAAPAVDWPGVKIVTSGIIADSPELLGIFDDLKIAIVADDIAHESRAIRIDAAEDKDPMEALAEQFAEQDQDPLLYDPAINSRPPHIVEMVRQSGAQGVVVLMMTFCDPEEMEYPSLMKGLKEANIPLLKIGYDHQIKDFGQARTSLEAFADVLSMRA
ncbi:MAG TPA: 2-hydroxyacyl-CoA dehydratase [Clostridiales bacterium]|jgi:bcr-type benzoyl-CoA reductase subunit C|nr:2-hydroxyacyl-CoA dehydratase [Clostridiales bacterium]